MCDALGEPVMGARGEAVRPPPLDFVLAGDVGREPGVAFHDDGTVTLTRDEPTVEGGLACVFGAVVAPARVCTERQLLRAP